ncbi:DUF4377 domain-containing protein [Vibrio splendidus]|nr:DUF4377 domain-containing protein [Vibrio splendidus]MCC4880335.1 DUF4377 domain-containing protein [Vibrio splendidus]
MKKEAVVLIASLMAGCSADSGITPSNQSNQIMTINVAAEKADCYGVAPMKCMVVNNELFYSEIKGFHYESGYKYELKIKRTQAFTEDNVPADASLYEYHLMEILSKTKA